MSGGDGRARRKAVLSAGGRGNCGACDATCCRYITIQIRRPARKADVDEVRWFLAHQGVTIFIERRKWYVQVDTACRHLTADRRCAIYGRRFQVCRDHDVEECEGSDGEVEAPVFETTEAFDAYWARQRAAKHSPPRLQRSPTQKPGFTTETQRAQRRKKKAKWMENGETEP